MNFFSNKLLVIGKCACLLLSTLMSIQCNVIEEGKYIEISEGISMSKTLMKRMT